jgi:hypothetical protein
VLHHRISCNYRKIGSRGVDSVAVAAYPALAANFELANRLARQFRGPHVRQLCRFMVRQTIKRSQTAGSNGLCSRRRPRSRSWYRWRPSPRGYDCFTPLQSTTRKRRDQAAGVQAPAFPGYVFARVDVRFRLPLWCYRCSGSPQRVPAEGPPVCVRALALPASQTDAKDREPVRQRLDCIAELAIPTNLLLLPIPIETV